MRRERERVAALLVNVPIDQRPINLNISRGRSFPVLPFFCPPPAQSIGSIGRVSTTTFSAGVEGDGDGDEDGGTNAAQAESGPATKRSLESVKAGERLMDALELAELELKLGRAEERAAAKAKRRGEPAPPARRPNPVLLNLSPLRYVLRTLQVQQYFLQYFYFMWRIF